MKIELECWEIEFIEKASWNILVGLGYSKEAKKMAKKTTNKFRKLRQNAKAHGTKDNKKIRNDTFKML